MDGLLNVFNVTSKIASSEENPQLPLEWVEAQYADAAAVLAYACKSVVNGAQPDKLSVVTLSTTTAGEKNTVMVSLLEQPSEVPVTM